ncbi:G-type lectin S-receptor-like serine/threonine-protein kinase SD2-5 [Magnolia sinica]|uniref:G-type lectin S-receptor-like serine/threonine-protein kinase SD2-5 n=1 Tax=Magnolia sinica TaxID=86752 RepID=UPI00265B1C63|nr:G-type lectin S-receptor-like serine/threonine-protein kinase SD2-5 [Magnolia sinica]
MRANPIPGPYNYNSSAFIKIQRHYLAPTPQPVNSPVTEISLIVKSRSKVPLAAIISGSVALLVVFILSAICIVISRKKKKKKEREDDEEYFKQVLGMPRKFSYEDLRIATDDFRVKLGEGGFGSVFKGILEDDTKIAVKQLEKIGQGMKEFLAEVETIGNIHHFNLVQLIGFCAERSHRLLVYEYMSNGSLDHWIFSENKNQVLNWQTRKKIILDIAKGLAYLHEECRQRIVHLDIKPQNILLDDSFSAKVSDFGLSKLMDRDQSQVQTTMRGTPGYLAPEWRQLRITLKVDIYSFGIVVLEIVCGRKNLDRSRSEPSKHLLRLLQEKAEENRLIDIIDVSSADMQLHREEAMKMIKLAAWCLQDDHTRRPLMSMVMKVLEGAMEVEPEISYRFSNAMAHNSTTSADFHILSDPPQASVLSAPR